MKKQILFAIVCASTILFTASANAAVVVDYDFTGEPGDQAFTAGTTLLDVAPMNFTRGAGLTATAAANSISSASWNSLSADEYFSFGFTVDPGFEADITSIALSTRSSGTGPGFLSVYSSEDSFATALFSFEQVGTANTDATYNFSLTGLTGPVEFRMLADNTTSAGGGTIGATGTFRVNSAVINGDVVAVPEPTSLALGGIGLVALAGIARARRKIAKSN